MAEIKLGTSGGRMPEVGMALEHERRTDKRAKEERKFRVEQMVFSMKQERERMIHQANIAKMGADRDVAIESMRVSARSDMEREKLAADVSMFERDMESEEARLIIGKMVGMAESDADRSLRAAEHSRRVAADELGATYRYGTRYSVDKERYEPIPVEEMPPGVPEGGLETAELAIRAAEAGARMTKGAKVDRSAQLRDAAAIGSNIERYVDRIQRLKARRDDIELKSMDLQFDKVTGAPWVATATATINSQVREYEKRISGYVSAKVALETGYGQVPEWVSGKPLNNVKSTLAEFKKQKRLADGGNRSATERIEIVLHWEGKTYDEVTEFLETYIRNMEQYGSK